MRLAPLAGLLLWPVLAGAQPVITLHVPPDEARFENFATIALPAEGIGVLEIVLEGAVTSLRQATVRVTLNEMPMTPFVSLNGLPRGVRAIVRLGLSLSPDYSLRAEGENVLALTAVDEGGLTYRGQFYLVVDATKSTPEVVKNARAASQASAVQPPPRHSPPAITIRSSWPRRTAEGILRLDFVASDTEGLRRVVVEVNGKDVEEVVLRNERPIRKKDGLIARGALPGQVTGDGHSLSMVVPVRLERDRVNVVAVRAENILGLTTRTDRTVQRDR